MEYEAKKESWAASSVGVKVDKCDDDEMKSMGIPCVVCQNKLKEEKSPKRHMKGIHTGMESIWKLIEAMRIPCVVCPANLKVEKNAMCHVI